MTELSDREKLIQLYQNQGMTHARFVKLMAQLPEEVAVEKEKTEAVKPAKKKKASKKAKK